jgi:predicted nucleic acid-binding protein
VIAIDTSTWIAFLSGESGLDVEAADEALSQGGVVLPPVVLTELMSDPKASRVISRSVAQVPLLLPKDGYWERTGLLRASILSRRLRARLADSLIAQSCIDEATPLLTRDKDFRHFARWGGLKLVVSL